MNKSLPVIKVKIFCILKLKPQFAYLELKSKLGYFSKTGKNEDGVVILKGECFMFLKYLVVELKWLGLFRWTVFR